MFLHPVKAFLVQILLQEESEDTDYYFPGLYLSSQERNKTFLLFLCLLEMPSKGNKFSNNNNYFLIITILFKVFYHRKVHEAYA